MKLKKIASLALAGVMAVSMLAGCANKPGTNNDGNGDGQVETTVTVADVLNKAQTGDVKVNFTENADLNAALQTAIAEWGIKVDGNKLTTAAGLVGIDETASKNLTSGYQFTTGSNPDVAGLLTKNVVYAQNDKLAGTYTTVGYKEFKSYPSTASALTAMANEMNDILGNALLDTHSDTSSLGKGDKYYTYSYDGNVALVILNQPNGTVNYGLFYVINQTVAVATYNG